MEKGWTIGSIIDLEYALERDRSCSDEVALRDRDRAIFLNHIYPCIAPMVREREESRETKGSFSLLSPEYGHLIPQVIFLWLEQIKKKSHVPGSPGESFLGSPDEFSVGSSVGEPNVFPGSLYEEVLSLMGPAMFLMGIMGGFFLCLSFFSYTGKQPLNVSYFLAGAILPQLLLLLILLAGVFTASKLNPGGISSFISYPFLGSMAEKLFMAMNRTILGKISPSHMQVISSALSIVRQGREVYGSIFFWPLFMIMQIFAIAFNGALLCFILFRVFFFDTAFGWQSTIQVGAEVIEKIVRFTAYPWSWMHPSGFAVPGLEQV
ncbi:MAG: DUF2868 domain-containing protein, partial [Desulfamplus sp.]|nr:DUF2868 domain-containing protein [Desulfamplus sp.]